MFSRKPRSLKYRIGMALLNTVAATAMSGMGLMLADQHADQPITVGPAEQGATQQVIDGRPLAKGSPAAIFAKHADECWTKGQEAKAALPGHVIARTDSELVMSYRSDLLQRSWAELPKAYGGEGRDAGVETLAFCK